MKHYKVVDGSPVEVGSGEYLPIYNNIDIPVKGSTTIALNYRSTYILSNRTNVSRAFNILQTANGAVEVTELITPMNISVAVSGLNIIVTNYSDYPIAVSILEIGHYQ